MELIAEIESRRDKKGILRKWGKFYCEPCKNYVERTLSQGKRDKSCGCIQYEILKGKPKSEEHRQKISKGNKGKNKSEEHKQKLKENHADYKGVNNPMYGKKQTEETRQKIRETHLKNGKNKGVNNPMYGKHHTEETKGKIRMGREGRYIGIFASNWNGGISFEKYGIDFTEELKQQILERDNYTCQNPNCEIENPKGLDCHHIDYNKKNNSLENLTTLCKSCHMKTNGKNNRVYWTEFYQIIMRTKIMECLL